MTEISLEAIEELMDNMLDKKLEPIKSTLAEHTAALEILMSEKKNKDESDIITAHRFDRLEDWAKKVGSKVGISPEL